MFIVEVQMIVLPATFDASFTLQAAIFHTFDGYIIVIILLSIRVHKDIIVVLLIKMILLFKGNSTTSHFIRTANVLMAI